MGWKNGAILRKKVRQPKPEFLPYPDSEGVWEIHNRAFGDYSIVHAVDREGEIVLIGLRGESITPNDIHGDHIQFRKKEGEKRK